MHAHIESESILSAPMTSESILSESLSDLMISVSLSESTLSEPLSESMLSGPLSESPRRPRGPPARARVRGERCGTRQAVESTASSRSCRGPLAVREGHRREPAIARSRARARARSFSRCLGEGAPRAAWVAEGAALGRGDGRGKLLFRVRMFSWIFMVSFITPEGRRPGQVVALPDPDSDRESEHGLGRL